MSALPGSPVSHNPSRFFGLDIGSLWRDLLTAWRGMIEWRAFSWLWPRQAVRLYLPTGGQALSRGLNAPLIEGEKPAGSARFEAILLPENQLLRRTLELPRLQPAEMAAALAFETQALSPFASGDVVWAHELEPQDGNSLRVHVVLASRKLIAQHMEAVHPQLKLQTPEVWVPRAKGPGFVMLPGFGEARRQRQSALWRGVSVMLVLLALALLLAMAVTPSVQLYLRYMHANRAMAELQKKAGPAMAQREALARTTEQLANLAVLVGKQTPPLKTLKLITEALPDDTSLLSLQIQGSKVSIAGQTGNAAALMKQLGSTPGLRDVRAPTPATKPLGAPRESFTIEFTLDPVPTKPAP